MALSERHRRLERLARELEAMERCWVVSPPPHDPLRFQVADTVKNEVLQTLRDAGYEPVFRTVAPRMYPTGLMGACLYEIALPAETPAVVDDRAVKGEVSKGKKPDDAEVAAMLKACRGKK